MSKCFSCGQGFKGSVNELLSKFKIEYEEKGTVRYFYKLSDKGDVKICRKSSFKNIFENQIKPNYVNGANYAHIVEHGNKTI